MKLVVSPQILLSNLRRCMPLALESIKASPEPKYDDKGARGKICVVGGSKDYTGAPYFSAISAMRTGADLAYVVCCSDASQPIKSYSPDLMVKPILDTPDEKYFESEMMRIMGSLHALVVGPGLGRDKLVQGRAIKIIEEAKKRSLPLVIDADGLQLIAEYPLLLKSYPRALLTPNKNELERLVNKFVTNESSFQGQKIVIERRNATKLFKVVDQCSKKLQIPILAKGVQDIICEPSGKFSLFTKKNISSARRCGGQGDILAGIAATFMHWLYSTSEETANEQNQAVLAGYYAAMIVKHCNALGFNEKGDSLLCSDMINKIHEAKSILKRSLIMDTNEPAHDYVAEYEGELTADEINRYQRQMLVDQLSLEGQLRLKKASVLIVGAGGLGCPSAIYLAAAGIGKIGLIDDDTVEISNLHRQILHTVDKVGLPKVDSIKQSIFAINPNVDVQKYHEKFTRHNAVDLVEKYTIVLDACDNLPTRHLINDACVFARKPLVSGAALRTDGQLSVYNYDQNTPCFRCLFPDPIDVGAVGSCSEQGVLGVVPGIIGILEAYEVIKIASGIKPSYANKLLFYSGIDGDFKILKLARRKQNCASCGPNSTLTRELIDYEAFINTKKCKSEKPLGGQLAHEYRLTLEDYKKILDSKQNHILIDVRPEANYKASHFKHAINIPLSYLIKNIAQVKETLNQEMSKRSTRSIYIVCKRGISSQQAAFCLLTAFKDKSVDIKDIRDGMTGWAQKIDKNYSCF